MMIRLRTFCIAALLAAAPLLHAQWASTSGTTSLTNTGDNVAIGVSSNPAARLHVFGGTNTSVMALYGPNSNTTGTGPFGALFTDTNPTEGYCCGILASLQGNSLLRVSNIQLGYLGSPTINSMGASALYLNSRNSQDVIVSQAGYANGLRVQGTGNSSFTGRVGIGTTAPAAWLHINDAGVTSAAAREMLTTTSVTAYIQAAQGQNRFFTVPASGVEIVTTTDSPISFGINKGGNSSPDMIIASGGNVGIGTASPAAKLHVSGAARIDGNLTVNGTLSSSSALQAAASGMTVSTGGTASGRLLSMTQNWVGLTSNASYASGWNLDDTTLPGWLLKLDSNTSADQFVVYRVPPGTNPHTNQQPLLAVTGNGRVGIGAMTQIAPREALDVTGNIIASGNISADGTIYAKYQDVAEWVPATTKMSAGTVVVLNRTRTNEVMPSERAYDTAVAGVVSEQPGVVLGKASDTKAQVATTGRVRVHVDATRAAVAVGDLLVTSDRPGFAMKSQPVDLGGVQIHRPGTVIGKALEPLPDGQGDILVLLSLQ
jgi:hypothetical protein